MDGVRLFLPLIESYDEQLGARKEFREAWRENYSLRHLTLVLLEFPDL